VPQKTTGQYAADIRLVSRRCNSNGILWTITGQMLAFDATSLAYLYDQSSSERRDKLPASAFYNQTVANGRYMFDAEERGSLRSFPCRDGYGRKWAKRTVGTALAAPIQVQVAILIRTTRRRGGLSPSVMAAKAESSIPHRRLPTRAATCRRLIRFPRKQAPTTSPLGYGFGNATITARQRRKRD